MRLFDKFEVTRTDGRDQSGGDKEGARYFVLCYSHDPLANAAMSLVADLYEQEGDRAFADDLRLASSDAELPAMQGGDYVTSDLILMRYEAKKRLR